jgi:hypothetical protein
MKKIMETLRALWDTSKIEIIIFIGVLIFGGIHTYYVHSLGLTIFSVDQNSHLNFSRLFVDSLTPGISQIGYWPPLLHILLVPFTAFTTLYQTGLAGAFVLVPVLGLACIFLYKIILDLTNNKLISIGGVLLLITNPYVLYYSVTPMTEVLFIASLFGVGYFLMLWLKDRSFSSLVYLSLFITLASISRFEGFILIPLVALIIITRLFYERKSYYEIEATTILFSLIALIGLVSVVLYSFAFGGNPLEFVNGQWTATAQQKSFFLPTAKDLGLSILYMAEASKIMIGEFLVGTVLIFFAFSIFLLLEDKRFFKFIALSAVLLSPLIFDIFALYQGNIVLYVENLAPFNGYFNERYSLYSIGFVTVTAMFFVAILNERMELPFKITKNTIALVLLTLFIGANALFFISEVYANEYSFISSSDQGKLPDDQRRLARVLASNYDGGKILITRALQNYVTVEAGIPLKNYIHESNFGYYDQALEMPWLYARFVVMYNPEIQGIEDWRKENEKISNTWAHSESFHKAYELIYENDSERLYVIRDSVVGDLVASYDINPEIVPSLNNKIANWDQYDFYKKILASNLK